MLRAIFAGFTDVFMKSNRNTFYKTIILTILSYIILIAVLTFVFANLKIFQSTWLNSTIDIMGGVLAFILSLFLLPSVVSAFSELFSEKIITNTEKKLFKTLPKATDVPTLDSILYSIGFSFKSAFFIVGLTIGYFITLPFLVIPVLGAMLTFATSLGFYIANAVIIGKGYFDTVAMRYCTDEVREDLWYSNRLKLIFTGIIIAFLFSIPFVNILAPVYSFSLMTRIFWQINSKKPLSKKNHE